MGGATWYYDAYDPPPGVVEVGYGFGPVGTGVLIVLAVVVGFFMLKLGGAFERDRR